MSLSTAIANDHAHVDDLLAAVVRLVDELDDALGRVVLFVLFGRLVRVLEEPVSFPSAPAQSNKFSDTPVTWIHSVQSSGGGTTFGEKLYKNGTVVSFLRHFDYCDLDSPLCCSSLSKLVLSMPNTFLLKRLT